MKEPLAPEALYRRCDFGDLAFETTADLDDLQGLLGQDRAVEAIRFGVAIEREGYNIFAFGPDGTGKHSAVRQILEKQAAARETPPDLCYVRNFEDPQRPRLISLPPGEGRALCKAMEHLVEEVRTALQSALESDEYQNRRQRLEKDLEEGRSRALAELAKEASESGLVMVRTPLGIVFAPQKDEEVLSPEELEALSESERRQLEQATGELKEKLQRVMRQFPRWKRETRDRIRELNREVSRFAIGPLLDEVRERFEECPEVLDYLGAVERDIVEGTTGGSHADDPLDELMAEAGGESGDEGPSLRRYRVNLLVDRSDAKGAPVVYEDNPTYQNLVGRVEHVPQMGTLVTDFTLIRPGAMHRANGGYLLLDALKLLSHPYAWEGLKRALRSGSIRTESLAEAMNLISTYSLRPEPVDLSVKIVLFGSPLIYYLLSTHDPDFGELFKVAADFGEQLDWNDQSPQQYARLVAKLAREKELRPFDRAAVARVIERGARSVGDSRKLSLYMGRVLDLMREADHWAAEDDAETTRVEHVDRAAKAREFRSDRLRERVQESMRRGIHRIETDGAAVGQVNGLSVLELDDFAFGRPSRITAAVRLGKGEVVDIEREVELSGPLHSKGVLILSGFLGGLFAADRPLSLAASLVFEQSYSGVDGDSASSAELYALLSAISGVPLRQSLAVTGSVDQTGEVQAIGGVNEKIEGFFDLCAARGLSGDQGVLIPATNVDHLMLREDVVEAVRAGRFRIYPVASIAEGIELLTGLPAGERGDDGRFPEGSVFRRVDDRLAEMAAKAAELRAAAAPGAAG